MIALAIPVVFLLLVLVWLFLIMVNQGYQQTFGALLHWLSKHLRQISVGVLFLGFQPFHSLADVVDNASNAILNAMGAGIEAIEDRILQWWGAIIAAIQGIGETVDQLAHDTGQALVAVPGLVFRNARVLRAGVWAAIALWAIEHRKMIASWFHDPGAHLRDKAISTLQHAIALPSPRIGRIERKQKADHDLLEWLKKNAVTGTAIGVVGYALTHLGLGHLFRSQCKTNTKQLCGTNPSWLENFLLAGLTVFSFGGLVAVATYLKPLVADAADVVTKFWRIHPTGLIDPDFASGGTGTVVRDPSFGEA